MSTQTEMEFSQPSKVESKIEIDFWTGMKLLGVMRTGKQLRTHLVTGGLLLSFGMVTIFTSPFELTGVGNFWLYKIVSVQKRQGYSSDLKMPTSDINQS